MSVKTVRTANRRVGPPMEKTRGTYRYLAGKTITFGQDHDGYYTNLQHAIVRVWAPLAWFGYMTLIAILDLQMVLPMLGLTVASLVFVGGWWLDRRIQGAAQARKFLDPLAKTLSDVCGWPAHVRSYLWLHFPIGWRRDPDAVVKIEFKHDAANSEEKKKKILEALAAGLGSKIDPRYISWHTEARHGWPYLTMRPAFPPPNEAMFVDNLPRIERYRKVSQIALGIGLYDETEVIDIDDDAPHMVLAADSGRGKSTVEASITAQLLHKGWIAVILDPKTVSLQAFKGLPNVVYCAGAEQTHNGLLAVKAEMQRRASLLDVEWGEVPPDMGAPIIVPIEEADTCVAELRDWKEDEGEGRSNVRSIGAMNRLRNMGRELNIHLFVVTQTGGANALGGAGSQTGFGFQLISANHAAVWKKLAPQVRDIPAQSKHRGRWHLNKPGSGDTPIEIQTFGFTDPPADAKHLKFAEARAYAVSGRVGTIPELLQGLNGTSDADRSYAPNPLGDAEVRYGPEVRQGVPEVHASHLRLVPTDRPRDFIAKVLDGDYDENAPVEVDELMTLSEACAAGVIPLKLNAAKQASGRLGFPAEVLPRRQQELGAAARQYRRSELEDWARKRNARLTVGAGRG